MNEFIKQLLSLSLSGSLLFLLLLLLKKLYKNRLSKCWQYYIYLAAVLRFLVPFAPDAAQFPPGRQPSNTAGQQFSSHGPAAKETSKSGQTDSSGSMQGFGQTDGSSGLQGSGQTDGSSGLQGSEQTDGSGSMQGSGQTDGSNGLQGSAGQHDSADLRQAEQTDGFAGLLTSTSGLLPVPDFGDNAVCLFFIWLVPALGLLLKKIASYHEFVRYIRTAGRAVDETGLLDLLAFCEEACRVKRPVELYCSPHLASPVMTGFFHPCIAIPEKKLPEKELSLIFTHELYHYRRRDMFYKWLIQTVVCIHWFNPLVYLLEKEVNLACELSCDEAVIHSLPAEEKKAYGNMLLYCSRAALFQKTSASSLTLAEGAKQLKERLSAIMRYKHPTKKTKLAAASLTAAVCFGSTIIGAYAAPARPVQTQNQTAAPADIQTQNQAAALADIQTQNQAAALADIQTGNQTDPQAEPDSYAAASTVNTSKYQALLALRTDSYQNQTVRQFRSKAAFELDTPQGNALLEQAFQDETLHLHRLDNEDAFFLRNTLMLAGGSWKKVPLEAVGVERPLENGQLAELDFKAEIRLNNPDIKVSEYEAAFRGLAATANAYLNSKTDAELSDASSKSASRLSKEALKSLKKYAKSINKKGNLTLTIYMCCCSADTPVMRPVWDASASDTSKDIISDKLPDEVRKVLSLKVNGYEDYTLKQFSDYIGERYEADYSLWKARQHLWKVLDDEARQNLSEADYQFLHTTLPCTESESTYPGDRTGSIPPDFSCRYELPYAKHRTTIGIEWAVRYEAADPKLTVGQRDRLILNVINGMDEYVKTTWETTDIASIDYLKNIRSRLDQLVEENSGSGLQMTVFHCLSDGKSA